MVWAATITSAASGAWSAGATWVGGVKPGIDDYAEIAAAHNVYVNTAESCAGLNVIGAFRMSAGGTLTIKDAAGTHAEGTAHILVSDAATSFFYSQGTKASPALIKSASTTPTYPIRMIIKNAANPDARTLTFDFMELRNFAPSIGNHTNYLFFNTGDVTNDGVIKHPTPIQRDQKLENIYCEGRSYSRVFPEGGHAGVLELTGIIPWTGYSWQTLVDMRDARTRISYIGQFCTMPKALIESLRFGDKDGPYLPFSLTLVEDR